MLVVFIYLFITVIIIVVSEAYSDEGQLVGQYGAIVFD